MPGVKGQRSGGHNRVSGHLHILRGTFRKDRHGDPDAAAAAAALPKDLPTPRKPLKGEAKQEWDRVVAELEAAKAIASIDGGRLYQYVNLFAEVETIKAHALVTQQLIAQAKKAIKSLRDEAFVQALEQVVRLQQLAVRQTSQLRQGRMSLRQYLNDLGLTPVARHGKQPQSNGGQKPASRVQSFMAGRSS